MGSAAKQSVKGGRKSSSLYIWKGEESVEMERGEGAGDHADTGDALPVPVLAHQRHRVLAQRPDEGEDEDEPVPGPSNWRNGHSLRDHIAFSSPAFSSRRKPKPWMGVWARNSRRKRAQRPSLAFAICEWGNGGDARCPGFGLAVPLGLVMGDL